MEAQHALLQHRCRDKSEYGCARADSYQSEAALEQEFIRLLGEQGYQYLPIHNEADLIYNLRERLEIIKGVPSFNNAAWLLNYQIKSVIRTVQRFV